MATLAIVDDTRVVHRSLTEILEAKMPEVTIADYFDGPSFLEALRSGKHFDLVLMDGNLPDGFSGPSYTAASLAICPNIIVIGFSGTDSTEPEFRKNGAKYFLPKVSSLKQICALLTQALQPG